MKTTISLVCGMPSGGLLPMALSYFLRVAATCAAVLLVTGAVTTP